MVFEDDCVVCLDPLSVGSLCRLTCGHILHLECAREWKSTCRDDTCPTCRQPMEELKELQSEEPEKPVDSPDNASHAVANPENRPPPPQVLAEEPDPLEESESVAVQLVQEEERPDEGIQIVVPEELYIAQPVEALDVESRRAACREREREVLEEMWVAQGLQQREGSARRPSRDSPRPQSAGSLRRPRSVVPANRPSSSAVAAVRRVEAAVGIPHEASPPRGPARPALRRPNSAAAVRRPNSATAVRRPNSAAVVRRPDRAGAERRPNSTGDARRPSSAGAVRRGHSSPSVIQEGPEDARNRRVRAASSVPSRHVAPQEGTVKVRKALREMAAQLGVVDEMPELLQALKQMHKHQPGLASGHGARSPATSPNDQAAAVLRACLQGRRVPHPCRATFHRVGASAPALPIDHAVRILLQQA